MSHPSVAVTTATATAGPVVATDPPVRVSFRGRFGEPAFVIMAATSLTIAQVLALAVTEGHLEDADVPYVALQVGQKMVRSNVELGEYCGLGGAAFTYVLPVRDRPDDSVSLLLNIRLRHYIAHPPADTVIMICLGSAINTLHGSSALAEAQRQQFPEDIAKMFSGRKRIVAIQVDAGFDRVSARLQIYGLDGQWQPMGGLLQNRIKHFRHATSGAQLSTYPTHLANWSNEDRLGGLDLAGVNVQELGKALSGAGSDLIVRSWTGNVVFSTCGNVGRY